MDLAATASQTPRISYHATFSQPPGSPFGDYADNPSYMVGANITASWITEFKYVDLVLEQSYPFLMGQAASQHILARKSKIMAVELLHNATR